VVAAVVVVRSSRNSKAYVILEKKTYAGLHCSTF